MNESRTRVSSVGPRSSAASDQAPTTARGKRTRAALVNAAREVFEELGYDRARISDIAKRANISYGSFYHYFDSKDEVLQELLTVVAGEMFIAAKVTTAVSDDPRAKIESANRQYVAVFARNAALMAIIEEMAFQNASMRELKLLIREPYLQRAESGLRRLQAQGLADPSLDPRMTAISLGGMVEYTCHIWFLHNVDFEEECVVSTLTTLWANAIGLP